MLRWFESYIRITVQDVLKSLLGYKVLAFETDLWPKLKDTLRIVSMTSFRNQLEFPSSDPQSKLSTNAWRAAQMWRYTFRDGIRVHPLYGHVVLNQKRLQESTGVELTKELMRARIDRDYPKFVELVTSGVFLPFKCNSKSHELNQMLLLYEIFETVKDNECMCHHFRHYGFCTCVYFVKLVLAGSDVVPPHASTTPVTAKAQAKLVEKLRSPKGTALLPATTVWPKLPVSHSVCCSNFITIIFANGPQA